MSEYTVPARSARAASASRPAVAAPRSALTAPLRRHWRFVSGCGVAAGLSAYLAAAALFPARYTALGLIAVDQSAPSGAGSAHAVQASDSLPVQGEIALLDSPALIRKVVRELRLDRGPDLGGSPGLAGLPATAFATVRAMTGHLLGPAPTPVAANTAGRKAYDPSAAVARNLDVRAAGGGVVSVAFTAPSPERAAAVVNTLVDLSTSAQRSAGKAREDAAEALANRLRRAKQKLVADEQKLAATQQRYAALAGEGSDTAANVSVALKRAGTERAVLEAEYARAKAAVASGAAPADEPALASPALTALRRHVAEAARRLSGTHGAKRRAAEARLAAAKDAVSAASRQALDRLQQRLVAARQREAALQSQLASQQSRASERTAVAAQLAQLTAATDAQRAAYRSLESEPAGTDDQLSSEPRVHVLSVASPPAYPTGPRPLPIAGLGLLGGLGLGGFVVLMRRRRSPFADAADIRDETGLEILSAVPDTAKSHAEGIAQAVILDPSGAAAEALRGLRAGLRYGRGALVPRTVLFAAAAPGEGASSLAAAFARVAAHDRLRVLLVECDLIEPSMARLLGTAPSSGTLDALAGREHWSELVRRDPDSGLDYLLASAARGGLDYLVGNSTDAETGRLLESMQFKTLIAEAAETYNLIVLDTRAVTAAPDALLLAHAADAVLLVVRANATPRDQVQQAVGTLAGVSRRPPAVVLNAA